MRWSHSVSWCLAEGYGNADQRRSEGLMAQETQELETTLYSMYRPYASAKV